MTLLLYLVAAIIAYFGYRISDSPLCVPVLVFAAFTWITAHRLGKIDKE